MSIWTKSTLGLVQMSIGPNIFHMFISITNYFLCPFLDFSCLWIWRAFHLPRLNTTLISNNNLNSLTGAWFTSIYFQQQSTTTTLTRLPNKRKLFARILPVISTTCHGVTLVHDTFHLFTTSPVTFHFFGTWPLASDHNDCVLQVV